MHVSVTKTWAEDFATDLYSKGPYQGVVCRARGSLRQHPEGSLQGERLSATKHDVEQGRQTAASPCFPVARPKPGRRFQRKVSLQPYHTACSFGQGGSTAADRPIKTTTGIGAKTVAAYGSISRFPADAWLSTNTLDADGSLEFSSRRPLAETR